MPTEGIFSSLYELGRRNVAIASIGGAGVVILLLLSARSSASKGEKVAPSLPEKIPFLSNTLEVSTDPKTFWARALKTMEKLNTEILRFRLAGRPAYLVVGEKKTNTLFRTNSGFSVEHYHHILVRVMFGPTERDLERFNADKSGRAKAPLPGTEHFSDADRIWASWHRIFAENLLRTQPTNELGERFFANFIKRMTQLFREGEWSEMLVWDFIQRHQTECAARALNGDAVFDKFPDYFERLRDFDLAIIPIAFGPPKWMNPKPHADRERYIEMNRTFMHEALRDYDWSRPEVESSSWEPVFGSRLIRSLIRWLLDIEMDIETIAGIFGIQVTNQNANSVPASAWSIINTLTCPDPDLLPNVRAEAESAITVDPKTGRRGFDIEKLVTMPWLQAVYTETLRLRVGFSVTRDATRDTEIDGFPVAQGTMIQAPIPIAHYNTVWDMDGHPATEFWPQRHLKTIETKDEGGKVVGKKMEFSIGNRNGYWFPYGGGLSMCPGRHFARQEIIGTLAMFVTQFETEVVGWVKADGSPSEREAQNGVGMAVWQPDRDLRIRVKRQW